MTAEMLVIVLPFVTVPAALALLALVAKLAGIPEPAPRAGWLSLCASSTKIKGRGEAVRREP